MKKFFSSDFHLNSTSPGIIEWAKRPFKSVELMNKRLIDGVNSRCKVDDLFIHVGDFMNYGVNKGVTGKKESSDNFIKSIAPKLILLEGNHDLNNKVKPYAKGLILDIGSFRNVSVSHYPSFMTQCESLYSTFKNRVGNKWIGIHLCGHVHEKWKHSFDKENGVLNINIGCDVWNWLPVSESEIFDYILKLNKQGMILK